GPACGGYTGPYSSRTNPITIRASLPSVSTLAAIPRSLTCDLKTPELLMPEITSRPERLTRRVAPQPGAANEAPGESCAPRTPNSADCPSPARRPIRRRERGRVVPNRRTAIFERAQHTAQRQQIKEENLAGTRQRAASV